MDDYFWLYQSTYYLPLGIPVFI